MTITTFSAGQSGATIRNIINSNFTNVDARVTTLEAQTYLNIIGDWDASTNTPNILTSLMSPGEARVVSVAGNTNVSGITDWQVGDMVVRNAADTAYFKIDNSDNTSLQKDQNLNDLDNKATARTNLSVYSIAAVDSALALKQALNAGLTSISGLTTSADKLIYTTASNVYDTTDFTAFARTFLDDANATAARVTLGVVIGANVQAYDATLQSLSALGTAANKFSYTTGVDIWAEADVTAFARTILDDADAAAVRTTLGLVIGTNVQAYSANLSSYASNALPAQLNASGFKITGLADGSSSSDAATYGQLTSALAGRDWQESVLAIQSAPPVSPTTGDRYIVLPTGTGAWVGHDNAIAQWSGSAWVFNAANLGFTSWIENISQIYTYNGAAWVNGGNSYDHGSLQGLADDDHPQYYNQSRGDARYTQRSSNLSDISSASTARTNLGLAIGSNVQAYSAALASIAGLTTASDKGIYTAASNTYATYNLTTFGRSVAALADASAGRTLLGLIIGTDVQAYNATLAGIAAISPVAANKILFTSDIDVFSTASITSTGRDIIAAANAAAVNTILGLTIGADVQAYNAALAGISALSVIPTGKMIYTNGNNTFATTDTTTIGRSVMAAANQAAIATIALPSQGGNSGLFLTTNGTVTSWASAAGGLPTQTGNATYPLITDGTSTSWYTGLSLQSNGTIGMGVNPPTLGRLEVNYNGTVYIAAATTSGVADAGLRISSPNGNDWFIQKAAGGSDLVFQYFGLGQAAKFNSSGEFLLFSVPTANGSMMIIDSGSKVSKMSTTANRILYSSSTNTIGEIASANNGVLITSGAGVPSISSTIPTATQTNITRLGTIAQQLLVAAGLADYAQKISNSDATGNGHGLIIDTTSSTSVAFAVRGNATATTGFVVNSNGTILMPNLGAATTGTTLVVDGSGNIRPQSSSRDYKENIVKIDFTDKQLLALQPVSYRYKETKAVDVGLIAEDVHEIAPELVNFNNAGKVVSIKYDRVCLLLIQSFKRMDKRVKKLESQFKKAA